MRSARRRRGSGSSPAMFDRCAPEPPKKLGCRRGHRDRPQIFFASCSNRKITRWQPVVNDERAAECGGLSFPISGLTASLSLPATLRTTQSRLLSAVDSTTRAPKRFCDRAVILLAICNWLRVRIIGHSAVVGSLPGLQESGQGRGDL